MKRDINIYDVIGKGWGYDPEQFLSAIKDPQPDEEFCVHLNTPGGSITDGLAIANRAAALSKTHKVTMIVDGMAASMGSVIACAGSDLQMAAQSYLMIHNPWTLSMGDAEQLRKDASLLDSMKKQIMAFYVARFDKKEEELSALMDAETWIAGSESEKHGLKCTVVEGLKAAALVKGPLAFSKMPESVKGFYESVKPPAVPPANDKPPEPPVPPKSDVPPAPEPSPAPVPSNEIIELSKRLESITTECRKHQSAADKLRAELKSEKEARAADVAALTNDVTAKAEQVKALEARLSAISLTTFSLSPEVANWEDAMKAVGGNPKASTHPGAVLLAMKAKFPVMYDQWRESLKRGR